MNSPTISPPPGDERFDAEGVTPPGDSFGSLLDTEPDYEQPAPDLEGDTAAALLKADWHLRKIAGIERSVEQVADIYNAETARIEDWHQRQIQRLNRQRTWHLLPLQSLHAAILSEDSKRKTIELPHGTLKSRTYTKPTLSIDDSDAVMAWMLANHADALEPKRPGVKLVESYCVVLPTADGFRLVDVDTLDEVPGLSAKVSPPTFDIDTSPGSEF